MNVTCRPAGGGDGPLVRATRINNAGFQTKPFARRGALASGLQLSATERIHDLVFSPLRLTRIGVGRGLSEATLHSSRQFRIVSVSRRRGQGMRAASAGPALGGTQQNTIRPR
jgi:hypothetical protein